MSKTRQINKVQCAKTLVLSLQMVRLFAQVDCITHHSKLLPCFILLDVLVHKYWATGDLSYNRLQMHLVKI